MKTFVSKQFLAKSGIALIIGAVLVGAIVFHTAELKNRLNRTQASWSAFSEHAAPPQRTPRGLEPSFGLWRLHSSFQKLYPAP